MDMSNSMKLSGCPKKGHFSAISVQVLSLPEPSFFNSKVWEIRGTLTYFKLVFQKVNDFFITYYAALNALFFAKSKLQQGNQTPVIPGSVKWVRGSQRGSIWYNNGSHNGVKSIMKINSQFFSLFLKVVFLEGTDEFVISSNR